MIQLKNVTKVYETGGVKTPALNGISLDIKEMCIRDRCRAGKAGNCNVSI